MLEETGVDTTFEGLTTFRHTPNMKFDSGDIYFICRLRPVGSTSITFDKKEIGACQWMEVEVRGLCCLVLPCAALCCLVLPCAALLAWSERALNTPYCHINRNFAAR